MSTVSIQLKENADRLLAWISRHAKEVRGKEMEQPLPTTRTLGGQFSVSNSTAFRMLEIAEREGLLWRKPNGRFYPIRARALVERPKPLACLFRRLENWSAMYRDVMEGVCGACGESGIAVMLWPDATLVNHDNPAFPPQIANLRQQRAALDLFVRRYGDLVGGIVWDHDWDDRVIASVAAKIPSIMACRQTELPLVGQVGIDYCAAAIEVVGYLLARGYETIQLVEPFPGEPAIDQILKAFRDAFKRLSLKDGAPLIAHSPSQRALLIAGLNTTERRTALIFPEDNIAVELASELRKAGVPIKRVGIVSAQGSKLAIENGLTRMECDYRQIGRDCIALLQQDGVQKKLLPTRLIADGSTA